MEGAVVSSSRCSKKTDDMCWNILICSPLDFPIIMTGQQLRVDVDVRSFMQSKRGQVKTKA
eukprot:scaffold527740_cov23-Prasinocladus_malaysianus.AAC.1